MLSERDIYWAAGLLEGEGHFGLRRGGRDLVLQVGMTDKDVIDRFQAIFGTGSRQARLLPSGKMFHTLTVSDQRAAADIMTVVLPIMGSRRAAKIKQCLAVWDAKPLRNGDKPTCKRGHPFAGDNLRLLTEGKYTKRRCLECQKLRQRKHRAATTDAAGIFTL